MFVEEMYAITQSRYPHSFCTLSVIPCVARVDHARLCTCRGWVIRIWPGNLRNCRCVLCNCGRELLNQGLGFVSKYSDHLVGAAWAITRRLGPHPTRTLAVMSYILRVNANGHAQLLNCRLLVSTVRLRVTGVCVTKR